MDSLELDRLDLYRLGAVELELEGAELAEDEDSSLAFADQLVTVAIESTELEVVQSSVDIDQEPAEQWRRQKVPSYLWVPAKLGWCWW